MKKNLFLGAFVLFFALIIVMQCNNSVYAAETSGLTNGDVYNLMNKASGKCLNVNYGTDANGTNVTQYTKDGTIEQRFKLVYNSSRDSYKLYAMCSSNGTNRVVDIYRPIQSGANVDIWTPGDDDAQDMIITDRGNGYYSIHPRYNTSLAITSNGTNNGSGAGTSSSSTGNVYVTSYTGTDNQLWNFKKIAECYCYVTSDDISRESTDEFTEYYTNQMGYNYYSKIGETNTSNILNGLSSSGMYVIHGHGLPESIYIGDNKITSTDISNLASGSLSTERIVLIYTCYGADSSGGTSILDAVYGRGAQCAVAWSGETNAFQVNGWHQLFLEKVCDEKETIVEGFRHADYWLEDQYGYPTDIMKGMRNERGNIYNYLYN